MPNEDKGKSEMFDQSDIMGAKPYSYIGPDRTSEEAAKGVVKKLKKNKKGKGGNGEVAEGCDFEDGEIANVSNAIGKMVNKK